MAARAAKPDEYVRHKKCPQWGVGVLIDRTPEQRTYLFADGQKRTFKEAFCETLIEPAEAPEEEDRERLARGSAAKGEVVPRALNLALEAEILARPDDDQPFLVYADWLQQRSDPRGELIALHARLAAAPEAERPKIARAEAALLDAHEGYLEPPLLGRLVHQPKRKTDSALYKSEVAWRLGFLRAVRVARKSEALPPLGAVVGELATHPAGRFLRRLAVGPSEKDRCDLREVVTRLAAQPLPLLSELVLGDFAPAELELAASALGNASPLLSKLPALTELTLRGSVRFDAQLAHGALRALTIRTETPSQKTCAQLASARLPALEELTLSAIELDLRAAGLDRLFSRRDLPRLRRLHLGGAIEGEQLIHALVGSPLFAQLEQVVLDNVALREPVGALTHRFGPDVLAKLDVRPAAPRGPSVPPPGALGEAEVLRLAPDTESIVAARKIARPSQWEVLARDGHLVWGEYEGREHYEVFARHDGGERGCSCESRKDPCKHVLALLLIAASDHAFEARPVAPGHLSRARAARRYDAVWE